MKLYEIYFSPTGGTKRVSGILAEVWDDGDYEKETVDLLRLVREGGAASVFRPEDICLISVPSFAGRVPRPAAEKLREMKGNGARAVLNVVFGNRAIDDTLLELRDILEEAGFLCAAAMETVAEHSIFRQFGAGRPDEADQKELRDFCQQVRELLMTRNIPGSQDPADCLQGMEGRLQVPGKYPYKELKKGSMIPSGKEACRACGFCAGECPVHAIPAENPKTVDEKTCIGCMRCVAVCPDHARDIPEEIRETFLSHMTEVCGGRKENRLYLERSNAK